MPAGSERRFRNGQQFCGTGLQCPPQNSTTVEQSLLAGHPEFFGDLRIGPFKARDASAISGLDLSQQHRQDPMENDNSTRMEFATELAKRAGELGMEYFRRLDTLTIESKGHQDMVSEADRDVETFIRAALAKQYPDDAIVGEEHAPTTGTSGYSWVIDPIDGTANFVRGIPAWCVVIAGFRDSQTDVGIIHEPSVGESFYARRGGGAFLNGKPIRASQASSLSEGSLGTGFSNRAEARNGVGLIDNLLDQGGVYYRNASGALMLAYVASGRLLGYIEQHMNAWDCLAGMLMIEEAGGKVAPHPTDVLTKGTPVIVGGSKIFDKIDALAAAAFRG